MATRPNGACPKPCRSTYAAALAHTRRERPIPVYFIGVGEGVEDLEAFSAKEFASALLD